MDQVRQTITSTDVPEADKVATLHTFNETHATSMSFITNGNVQEKVDFIDALIKLLSTSTNDSLNAQILLAIRYLCRERIGLRSLIDHDNFAKIFEKCHLIEYNTKKEKEQKQKGQTTATTITTEERGEEKEVEESADARKSSEEAVKCLVNILMQLNNEKALFDLFKEFHIVPHVVTAIITHSVPKTFYFPLLRLLLQLFVRDSEIKAVTLQSEALVSSLILILGENVKGVQSAEVESVNVVSEALELLFFLTEHLGPLSGSHPPTDPDIFHFKKLIPMLEELLSLPVGNVVYRRIQLNVVKCMINVPAVCTADFDQQKTLNSLLSLLLAQLNLTTGNPACELTPLLLILHSISKAIPQSREIIKNAILPGWQHFEPTNKSIDPPVELQDPESHGHKLIQHMTSSNSGLSHYASELLFSLCDEDADEFVRLVGVGTGAGVLANRGLLANFMSGTKVVNAPGKTISEGDKKEWIEAMDRIEKKRQADKEEEERKDDESANK